MPTPTYTPLANITLGSSAASVTFSSISQAYRDLVLVMTNKTTANSSVQGRFNGDTGTNYSYIFMKGDGATAASAATSDPYFTVSQQNGSSTTNIESVVMNIMDYSATDKHKSVLFRQDMAASLTQAQAGRWANTAAITSIVLYPYATTFVAGSTFALYGVAA